jgi:RNA polymerase sigma-70 factor (ECF subfamily)
MMLQSDKGFEDLFFEAKAGNKDAENRLFSHLHASYLRLAKRRVREVHDAEDLVQETLETIFEKYKTADLVKGFLPWANQILFFKIGNYYRAQERTSKREEVDAEGEMTTQVMTAPDSSFDDKETSMLLRKALNKLKSECKKILTLLLREESREAIQRAFGGAPMGTIDSKIHRCRKKLKEQLIRDFGWEA